MINNLTVAPEDFDSLAAYYSDPKINLSWNLVFTLPAWLKVWWQHFGPGAELYLRSVRQNDNITGLAPLMIRNGTASFVGNTDVCDYQDFILVPGREKEFFNALLDELRRSGIKTLHLETVRPDSTVVVHLMPLARERQYKIDYHQSDVSSDIDLPASWDEYLGTLDGKQRHELRRKIRNLRDIGETHYRPVGDPRAIPETVDSFKLFPESRHDKAQFMTSDMQDFFRAVSFSLSEINVVRFGVLETDRSPMAMVMYFDYNNNIYLYNSAYDPAYKSASVGIISKAKCIQDNIEKKKRKFDFLKGAEQYKSYLGGKEIPLYRCEITITD